MRLMITGATGMVGRYLTAHPQICEHDLLTPSRDALDLQSESMVQGFLEAAQPDVVIHAAGRVGGIQANIDSPVSYLVENTRLGLNVLLGCARAGIKTVLAMGSSCMYPRDLDRPIREDDLLTGPLEPTNEGYAIAKILVARLCTYLNRTNPGYRYITIVPCNLYGKWDDFTPDQAHLIPAAINKLHKAKTTRQKTVSIWGDGTARREFMYASDVASFVVKALTTPDQLPEVVNVGTGRDYSVTEYYEMIADIVGFDGEFEYQPSRPTGMKRKLLDIEKQLEFGWKSEVSLSDGIRSTYQYYLDEVS